ncbi:MAG TPA: hypothetical protein VNN72_04750 [Polyangiaceae bacterium]|nr:hypothetical protein [Polyangiaceae bacterium]
MTDESAPAPSEVVVVIEEEVVLRGGAGTTTWLVPHNDGTVRPQRHPSASSEQLDRGAGIVWRTRITLRLERGAVLTRVHTRPSARRRSALEHLTSGASAPQRATTRTRFRVAAGGKLVEVPPTKPERTK